MSSTDRGNVSLIPLPRPLRVVAAVAVMIVLIYAAGWVLSRVGGMVSQVLTPVVVGVLLTALLMPVQLLLNHTLRFPRHLAAGVTVVGLVAVIAAVIYFVAESVLAGVQGVNLSGEIALSQIQGWLVNGPVGLDRTQLSDAVSDVQAWLTNHAPSLTLGAFHATSNAGTVLIGLFLSLIVAFFLLAEGDQISSFMFAAFKEPGRTKLRGTIRRVWVTLGSWARTQVLVSAADAALIGIGAAILQLPFVVSMSIITFLLCFIPIFGAVLAGVMFTLVALLFHGPIAALIMAVIVIVVEQLEGNVMQPLLMGKAVSLHPLVVLLGVTTGTYLMGLTGALLTVPILASVNAGHKYWVGRDPFPGLEEGNSAMSGSPRKLAPDDKRSKLPPKLGAVTPHWIEQERTATDNASSEVEETN